MSELVFDAEAGTSLVMYTNGRDHYHTQGLELGVTVVPHTQWRVVTHYHAMINAYEAYRNGVVTVREDGLNLPRQSVTAGVQYQPKQAWQLSVTAQHQGERLELFNDTGELDPYTLVNVHASYRLPNAGLTFFADVRNLTNTEFTERTNFNTPGINLMGGLTLQL